MQDIARDLILDAHAAGNREAALQTKQGADVLVTEAGWPIGGPRANHAMFVALKFLLVGEAHVVG